MTALEIIVVVYAVGAGLSILTGAWWSVGRLLGNKDLTTWGYKVVYVGVMALSVGLLWPLRLWRRILFRDDEELNG